MDILFRFVTLSPMPRLKPLLRKVPFLKETWYALKRLRFAALRRRDPEEIFTRHHQDNFWNDPESVSGSGSNAQNTATLVAQLRPALDQLGTTSLLDLPCGDFGWMSRVDLSGIHYTGGDIVRHIIEQNQRLHSTPGREFQHLNLLQGPLPAADAILCRDCLVHFSFADIRAALAQILATPARYLATTTYPATEKNHDIVTGDWRRLNLTLPPFSLPAPVFTLLENSVEYAGDYKDKTLAFWDLAELRKMQRSNQ